MKNIILGPILMLACFALEASTFMDTYTQLKKNPRYHSMSLLEIAIDRGESAAIQYFEFRATPADLRHARVLLQNKVAVFDEIIKEDHHEFITGAEKVSSLTKVEEARNSKKQFESLLREFDRKIASIDAEEAAQQARIEAENKVEPQATSDKPKETSGNNPEAIQLSGEAATQQQSEEKNEYSAVL